jgi:Fe2+ or Zn2+ uptake regulation protein
MSCGQRLTHELRAAGYRVTPQRLVILESVAHARVNTSAQQVFAEARRRLPGLDPATVYRTLQTGFSIDAQHLTLTGLCSRCSP